MLEVTMHMPRHLSKATFSFANVHGKEVCPSVDLLLETRRTAKRIVHIPAPAVVNTIQLSECPGELLVESLKIKRITRKFARSRMLGKISRNHPVYKNKPLQHIQQLLVPTTNKSNELAIIYTEYEKFFTTQQSIEASYPEWIKKIETLNLPSDYEISSLLSNTAKQPFFSIILPVYNTPEKYLHLCLNSILNQTYPHFQLCITDDSSTSEHIRPILNHYAHIDSRVHVHFLDTNSHISTASNTALQFAHGDFILFIDHDDQLAENALFHIAHTILSNPHAAIIYSDEDKIDEIGNRYAPHFKSDWNPDLFYAQNYISHLCAIKKTIIDKTEGFRVGVEGSQDYDLILQCLPYIQAEQIIHIPKILYHWRALKGSTALSGKEKGYAEIAGRKALSDFMATYAPAARVEDGIAPNTYRVRWPIPEPQPLVTLLIPTRDQMRLLHTCITSILKKTLYQNYEILILDNQSSEENTLQYFKELSSTKANIRIIRYDHPFNYSAINNHGVQFAHGDIIGLINNDIEVITPEWLGEMVSHAVRPDIGCVGAKLYYPDNTIQHAGVICSLGGVAGHSHKFYPADHPGYFNRLRVPQNLSAVTAACLLVRKTLYLELGGLDQANLAIAFNDVDFCLRAREAGYRNIWTPYAELYHHESVSRGYEDNPEKIRRFQNEIEYMKKTWGSALDSDPFYNINLTRDREDFGL